MPAPLQINLNLEEDRTLRELSYAAGVPERVKQRASALRLNAAGWTVNQIAQISIGHLKPSEKQSIAGKRVG